MSGSSPEAGSETGPESERGSAPLPPVLPVADLFDLGPPVNRAMPEGTMLFARRSSYRRRRLVDAARALPALGLLLWWVPLLWAVPDARHSASGALIYLFSVWIGLILGSGLLISALGRGAGSPEGRDGASATEPEDRA